MMIRDRSPATRGGRSLLSQHNAGVNCSHINTPSMGAYLRSLSKPVKLVSGLAVSAIVLFAVSHAYSDHTCQVSSSSAAANSILSSSDAIPPSEFSTQNEIPVKTKASKLLALLSATAAPTTAPAPTLPPTTRDPDAGPEYVQLAQGDWSWKTHGEPCNLSYEDLVKMGDLPGVNIPFSCAVKLANSMAVHWQYGGEGCTSWALEANNYLVGLQRYIPDALSLKWYESGGWCPGMFPKDVEALEVIRLRKREPRDIDVFINHKPPPKLDTFRADNHPRYVVARAMAEVHRIVPEWAKRLNEGDVQEVWLPSNALIEPFSLGGVKPSKLQVIPEAYDSRLYHAGAKPMDVKFSRKYNFLSVMKVEARKGWDILVRAFLEEFTAKDDVTLIIHSIACWPSLGKTSPACVLDKIKQLIGTLPESTRNRNDLPLDNIIVHGETTPIPEMPTLYAAAQAFVLPTHGEGWGLPLLEAMAMGLPTIATAWSGQLHFMNPQNSILIPVEEMVPAVDPGDPGWYGEGSKWAQASLTHLRKAMRLLYDKPEIGVKIGQRAKISVEKEYDIDERARAIIRRLANIKLKLDPNSSPWPRSNTNETKSR